MLKVDGKKIYIMLAKKGWSIHEFLQKARIHNVTFKKIIAGELEPSPVMIHKMAKALEMDVEEIIL